MAKHLLSRARLLITHHRSALPPALTRFLFGGPTPTKTNPEAAVASAKIKRELSGKREGTEEDDDEGAGVPWGTWRPDVAWLTKALEPALQLYKQYNWKPFTCKKILLPLLSLLLFLLLLIVLVQTFIHRLNARLSI